MSYKSSDSCWEHSPPALVKRLSQNSGTTSESHFKSLPSSATSKAGVNFYFPFLTRWFLFWETQYELLWASCGSLSVRCYWQCIVRQQSLIIGNKNWELCVVWNLWELCAAIKLGNSKQQGKYCLKKVFELCLPMIQILKNIWKIPYVQTVQFSSTFIARFRFFCSVKSLLQQTPHPDWSFLMAARTWMITGVQLHDMNFPAVSLPAVLWDCIPLSPFVSYFP